MPGDLRNVDGSPIRDAEEKKPGCLVLLALILVIPMFAIGKLYDKARRWRYWKLSDRDYEIMRRKRQRQNKREEERKKQ